MTFRVGQKVVCIGKFPQSRLDLPFVTFPEFEQVYTVRANVLGHNGKTEAPGILLLEIKNSIGPRGVEYNFHPTRFRPLVERKTDISIFTKMLKPQGADA